MEEIKELQEMEIARKALLQSLIGKEDIEILLDEYGVEAIEVYQLR